MEEETLRQLNKLLEDLMNNPDNEHKLIELFTSIAERNQNHYRQISSMIKSKFLTDPRIDKKIQFIKLIDSLIKSLKQLFLKEFTNDLYNYFIIAFRNTNEEGKIQLYKIYYTWKYIINNNLFIQLEQDLNLNEIKNIVSKKYPGLIERYDIYNEKIKKEFYFERNQIRNKNIKNNNNGNNNVKNILKGNQNHIVERKPNKIQNNNNLNLSELSDEAFSEVSPSQHSDNDDSSNHHSNNPKFSDSPVSNKSGSANNNKGNPSINPMQKEYIEDYQNLYQNYMLLKGANTNITGNSNNNSNNLNNLNNVDRITLTNMNNMALSLNEMLSNKRRKSPLSSYSSKSNKSSKSSNKNLNNRGNLQQVSNQSNQSNQVTQTNQSNQQIQMNSQLNFVNLSQFNTLFGNTYTNLNKLYTQGALMQYSNYPNINNTNLINLKPTSVEKFYSETINSSQIKLSKVMPFFSSLSNYYNELKNKIVSISQNYKLDKEIFQSQEMIDNIYKFSLQKLFNDIKNICPICGFRINNYLKFMNHLDIHFHYNFLKTKKDIVPRKEGNDKNSWITGSFLNEGNNSSYTLNAIMYYKNDQEHSFNKKLNGQKINEDNENYILPVDNKKLKCFYCGEEFGIKYFAKYRYWFYVNVVKIRIKNDELSDLSDDIGGGIGNGEDDFKAVHINCVSDYTKLINNNI